MLLQAFYSLRSERLLMERLEYDLLFRWFVGIGVDDAVWDHSVFSKNRDRLLEGDIAAKFLAAVLAQPRVNKLLSSDHFSVDGTLIEAWASMKSIKPKDGPGEPPAQGGGRNAEADFHGQKRSNDSHASTTDPDARLYRKGKGKETKLCFIGHGLMENRHSLLVDACLTLADGHAERVQASLSRNDMVVDPAGEIGTVLELHDRVAKNGSGRSIPLHSDLREALIAMRRLHRGHGVVIQSERGGPMAPLTIVVWFSRAYKALGFEGCSSHSGRRTFITRAARMVHKAGGSLRDVQLLAGHRSIQTTQRYIDGDSDVQRRLVAML
jgi:transposase-like protein DUF772/integrase-like protein